VLDRAILSCRIHRLEDQEQREAVIGVQHRLEFAHPIDALLEHRLIVRL
jgi:hypothetical protein